MNLKDWFIEFLAISIPILGLSLAGWYLYVSFHGSASSGTHSSSTIGSTRLEPPRVLLLTPYFYPPPWIYLPRGWTGFDRPAGERHGSDGVIVSTNGVLVRRT